MASRANGAAMPKIYSKAGGADCIIVSGERDFDPTDQTGHIHGEDLSYAFV